MKLPCPVCDDEVDLPVQTVARHLNPVDELALHLEVDARPLRRHLIDKHTGPDGDGGEPLPVQRAS